MLLCHGDTFFIGGCSVVVELCTYECTSVNWRESFSFFEDDGMENGDNEIAGL